MIPEVSARGWATAFDWERESAAVTDESALAQRLLGWLEQGGVNVAAAPPSVAAFGRYMRALRQMRGWNRPRLAREAGLDPLAVALLENGALPDYELTATLVHRLADAFGIPPAELAISPWPEPEPAHQLRRSLGDVLRERLSEVLRAPAWQPAYLGAVTRGGLSRSAPQGQADLRGGVLARPISLDEVHASLPGEGIVRVVPVLEPGTPPEPGAADLHLRILDAEERAVVGVAATLEIDGLPFRSEPSDERGVTRIAGVPLASLTELDALTLVLEREEAAPGP